MLLLYVGVRGGYYSFWFACHSTGPTLQAPLAFSSRATIRSSRPLAFRLSLSAYGFRR